MQERWNSKSLMSEFTDNELHTGYPMHKGWYLCVVDDVTIPLYLNVCTMKSTKQWMMADRTPIEETVKWVKEINRPVL